MADDPRKTDPTPEPDPVPTPEPDPEPGEGAGGDGGVVDSHGQPGINKERHDREMAEKDAKIAELEAKLEEAAKTEEGRAELLTELADVKASLADEKVSHSLELAGCLNVKMAKAVLADEYGGDVAKLKEACPYLFQQKQEGSTGLPPAGATGTADERRRAARRAAGLE